MFTEFIGLIKSYRFHVYSSTIYHLYMALCVSHIFRILILMTKKHDETCCATRIQCQGVEKNAQHPGSIFSDRSVTFPDPNGLLVLLRGWERSCVVHPGGSVLRRTLVHIVRSVPGSPERIPSARAQTQPGAESLGLCARRWHSLKYLPLMAANIY